MSSKTKEESKAGGAKKKLPLMPLLAGAIVLVGGGTFFFGQKVGAGNVKKPEKPKPGIRVKLDEMIVNLRDPDRFIRAAPEVEFKKEAKPGGGEGDEAAKEFAPFLSRIEGAVTLVFRDTTVNKLGSEEGIQNLERQMVRAINAAVEEPEGKVKDVTLGKFATQ